MRRRADVELPLARRRRQGVERPFELEPVDDQVAVALRLVGRAGLVVVVQERGRDLLLAAGEMDVRRVDRGRRLRGRDFDVLEVPVARAQRHAADVGPRLLAHCAHAQHVVAVARQVDHRPRLGVRIEVGDRPEVAVLEGRVDRLRLEVAHGRAPQLLAGTTAAAIRSAAARYFSSSSGETESTSPMLSKP